MTVPENLKYTKDHEWISIEGDVGTVGITDYAQGELGDIVYVELPTIGDSLNQFDTCASIEAVKAVSDLFVPVSGKISEINSELESNPQLINQDAFDKGWIMKIKLSNPSEVDKLLDAAGYKALIL